MAAIPSSQVGSTLNDFPQALLEALTLVYENPKATQPERTGTVKAARLFMQTYNQVMEQQLRFYTAPLKNSPSSIDRAHDAFISTILSRVHEPNVKIEKLLHILGRALNSVFQISSSQCLDERLLEKYVLTITETIASIHNVIETMHTASHLDQPMDHMLSVAMDQTTLSMNSLKLAIQSCLSYLRIKSENSIAKEEYEKTVTQHISCIVQAKQSFLESLKNEMDAILADIETRSCNELLSWAALINEMSGQLGNSSYIAPKEVIDRWLAQLNRLEQNEKEIAPFITAMKTFLQGPLSPQSRLHALYLLKVIQCYCQEKQKSLSDEYSKSASKISDTSVARWLQKLENAPKCANPACDLEKRNQNTDIKIPLGTRRCGRCLTVFYCSKECQRAHWAVHKTTCTSL